MFVSWSFNITLYCSKIESMALLLQKECCVFKMSYTKNEGLACYLGGQPQGKSPAKERYLLSRELNIFFFFFFSIGSCSSLSELVTTTDDHIDRNVCSHWGDFREKVPSSPSGYDCDQQIYLDRKEWVYSIETNLAYGCNCDPFFIFWL